MFSARLRKFLVISLILHAAFFTAAAVFLPERIVTKPQLIKIGVISKYKDPGAGSGSSVEPILKRAPLKETLKPERKEIVNPKKIQRPAKKVVKEKVEETNELVTQHSVTQPIQDGVQTGESTTKAMADTGFSEVGKGIGPEGSGLGTDGSGQGVEIGYPDYKINPSPDYPMIARRNGYEGEVLLRVWVLENGDVGNVELEKSSGYGVLDKSALEAVKGWIFVPGKKNGVPVASWVVVPIRFELSSG